MNETTKYKAVVQATETRAVLVKGEDEEEMSIVEALATIMNDMEQIKKYLFK